MLNSVVSAMRRGERLAIVAHDGFIEHQQQYSELFASKKRVMQCVDCHNPHQTVKYAKGFGALTPCDNCHFQQADYQKITDRKHAQCVDCHMPHASINAVGDIERYTGDMRTHLFAINPLAKSQFDKDGKLSEPYLALDYACKGCHNQRGTRRF